MSELKPKICMMPGCDKETFDKRSFFCREHEREFKTYRKAAGGLAVSVALFVLKGISGKKK